MPVNLTDLMIKSAKPREKRYSLFDTGGLYLEIAPNGSKWWRFRYVVGGKRKVISFGLYPDVSLKKARDKRDSARSLLAEGGDPSIKKMQNAGVLSGPTFSTVANEWFEIKSKDWVPRHAKRIRQKLDRYLISNLGKRSMVELAIQDFLPILREIEKREKYETARRVAQLCNQICRFARLTRVISNNPVEGISEVLVSPNPSHFKTITDLKKIGCLLRDIHQYPGRPVTAHALRIMPYVFVRSSELRGARWEEIDFKTSTWIIPGDRMKKRRNHIVPLARQVVAIFEDLKYFSGKTELCFPSPLSNTRPISDVGLLNGLRRIGYGRDEMCIHGFRAMASTLLNEKGYRPDIIEAQLAHKEKDAVRNAYNHAEYLEERRKMMQEWADYLDSLRDAE